MGTSVYHLLNRANAPLMIFKKPGDYEAFEPTLGEALEEVDMPILAYLPSSQSLAPGAVAEVGLRPVPRCRLADAYSPG